MQLTKELSAIYAESADAIRRRLEEFSQVPREKYFYEYCYCIMTPQSKAENALAVQKHLEKIDFRNHPCDLSEYLRGRIRFHNVKAVRLTKAAENWEKIEEALAEGAESGFEEKLRDRLYELSDGLGMKECSHFLRNIGFRGLGILDRHVLRCLVQCGVFAEVPSVASKSKYLQVEAKYREFAEFVEISPDELDLLFWSSFAGEILK